MSGGNLSGVYHFYTMAGSNSHGIKVIYPAYTMATSGLSYANFLVR